MMSSDGQGKSGCPADLRPRLLLYYPHGFSPDEWASDFEAGERPEASHWSMHAAAQHGFCATATADSRSSFWRALCSRLTYPIVRCDLAHLRHNAHRLRECDVVWAFSERELVAVLLGVALCCERDARPLICSEMVWLNDEWPTFSRLRRFLLQRLLKRTDALLIVTRGGAEELARVLPGVPVHPYRFGIPAHIYAGVRRTTTLAEAVARGRPLRVLVPGNDLRRDWQTAAAALGGDQRFEVTLLSRREHVAGFEAYGTNIHYVRAGRLRSLLDWYAWADIVVLASEPNRHGAGLTMLLEAAAAGVPLICAKTGDIDEYLPDHSVAYVPPRDPGALHQAALGLIRDPEAAMRRAERAQAIACDPSLDSMTAVEQRCLVFARLIEARRDRALAEELDVHELDDSALATGCSASKRVGGVGMRSDMDALP